jgi:hypothetical protein
MIRWMFCLIATVYFLQPLRAACNASVTNPTAASIQSGVVNWTMTYSGCPSLYSVDWVLDDFYLAQRVISAPPFTLWQFNTGTVLDGPFNVKVVLRDATSAIIATSADVSFIINNFGIGSSFTVGLSCTTGGVLNFQSIPTCGGTATITLSSSHTNSDFSNNIFVADGMEYAASGLPATLTYDTTQLTNGPHLFSTKIECKWQATSCGSLNNISTQFGSFGRAFIAFMVNVQNGTALRGVQPSIEHVTLTVGQTYPLDVVRAMADGTTTSGTFNLTMEHACLLADPNQPQLPYPCASGNAYPGSSAEGAAYISLSSNTVASGTPVTITANALGESYITSHGFGERKI